VLAFIDSRSPPASVVLAFRAPMQLCAKAKRVRTVTTAGTRTAARTDDGDVAGRLAG
jgi:hypothetical protein